MTQGCVQAAMFVQSLWMANAEPGHQRAPGFMPAKAEVRGNINRFAQHDRGLRGAAIDLLRQPRLESSLAGGDKLA
ncbi:hypothetical protein CEP88_19275 [Roseobacter denitrificans]|nr:hypothetical protein CEP88_19275 [Roseobacter denitrificans]